MVIYDFVIYLHFNDLINFIIYLYNLDISFLQ